MENRLAVIGIIIEEMESAASVNDLLHQHSQYIVGRMGIPYRSREISVITLVMDAPEQVIASLSGKLGMIHGISVKSMFAKSAGGAR